MCLATNENKLRIWRPKYFRTPHSPHDAQVVMLLYCCFTSVLLLRKAALLPAHRVARAEFCFTAALLPLYYCVTTLLLLDYGSMKLRDFNHSTDWPTQTHATGSNAALLLFYSLLYYCFATTVPRTDPYKHTQGNTNILPLFLSLLLVPSDMQRLN